MPLLPLVLLVSGLTAPPLEPTDIPLPEELRQAHSLGYRQPDDCVQLSRHFLRREMQAELPAIRSSHSAEASADSRLGQRTLAQTFRAQLLLGLCQERLEQATDALANFEQAEQLAHRHRLPRLEALALYHRARLLGLTLQRAADALPVLGRLQTLLQTRLQHDRELVLHHGLLRGAIAIAQQQLGEASLQLSRVEALLLASPTPSLSTWTRALEGDLQLARQQDDRALTSYAEAFDMAKEGALPLLPAQLAAKIAELFHHRGDLTHAIHYQEQALEQLAELGNLRWLSQSLRELATLNREAGDPNLALAQLFNALDLQRTHTPPLAKARLQLEIGQTYLQLPNLPQAQIYLQAALRTFLRLHQGQETQQAQLLLAELYLQQRQPRLAIQLLETVRQQFKPPARTPPELYHRLARAYEQQGQLQQALATYKLYSASAGQQQGERRLADEQFRERIALADKERQLKALAQSLNQLQSDRIRYRWWSLAVSLLTLGLGIGLLLLWRRNAQQGRKLHDCRQHLETHEASGLANRQALARELGQYGASETDRWYPEDLPQHPLNQRQHVVLLRPLGLSGLTERRGQQQAQRCLQALVTRVRAGLPAGGRLYALGDTHLLCLLPGQEGTGLHRRLAQLFTQLAPWFDAERLDPRLAVGIIGHPFLARSAQALKGEQLVELSYLALGAAVQLCERTATSQWVELTAIDCQQAAFFNGNVRERALEAIELGLVKAAAASGKPLIDWADLR